MEPSTALHRRHPRWPDRAQAVAFLGFAWRRALGDRVFQAAGALSFTTVFALAPLSMVVFGVLSAFPVFDVWSEQLSDYIFSNFVPSAAKAVEGQLRAFSANTSSLTAAGALALMVSLLITMFNIEAAFNAIWRVPTVRPKLSRFLVYWTMLTLGVLVAATSLALSTRFFALAIFETVPGRLLEGLLLRLAPMATEFLAFAAIFKLVPYRTVHWRHALAGAALSVLLFEAVKWGIGLYLDSFDSYQRIYGKTIAFVPIFLLWVYLGWSAVLAGASLASSLASFRYQPEDLRLPEGHELYGLLRLLGRFRQARMHGRGLHGDDILRLEPILSDNQVQDMLARLDGIGVVRRSENGEWLLARDLSDVTLRELYEAARLRVPVAEARLPLADDALGAAVKATLDELRRPLRELLDHPLSQVYEPPGDGRDDAE